MDDQSKTPTTGEQTVSTESQTMGNNPDAPVDTPPQTGTLADQVQQAKANQESAKDSKKASAKQHSQAKKEANRAENNQPAPEPEPTVEAEKPKKFVTLISADKRVMEVSIGGENWKGVTITVPEELEGEIRRILEEGGFFLKN